MPYTLAPGLQAYLDLSATFDTDDDSLQGRRDAFLALCRACTPALAPGWQSTDLTLGHLRVRRYQPADPAPEGGWPTLLYVHGGGWDLGELDTHDWFVHGLARHVRMAIVAVAYRLAPEYHYPAPLDDVRTVWAALNQGLLGPDLSTERLAVVGDSAGGNLAAGLCMALRRDAQRQPLGQALLYPVLSSRTDLPSMREHPSVPMMSIEGFEQCLAGYLPPGCERRDPCAMPLEADDFSGLAPAFIAMAEIDPLRDQGVAYHAALKEAGSESQLLVVEGLVHGGLRAFGVPVVEDLYARLAAWLTARI